MKKLLHDAEPPPFLPNSCLSLLSVCLGEGDGLPAVRTRELISLPARLSMEEISDLTTNDTGNFLHVLQGNMGAVDGTRQIVRSHTQLTRNFFYGEAVLPGYSSDVFGEYHDMMRKVAFACKDKPIYLKNKTNKTILFTYEP